MSAGVPELTDFSDEPKHVLDMYGPDVLKQGSYAYNCLMARRLAERGVKFTQLMHAGWTNIAISTRNSRSKYTETWSRGRQPRRQRSSEQRVYSTTRSSSTAASSGGRRFSRQNRRDEAMGPRSPPVCLYSLDGRRRNQAGDHLRRIRRVRVQRRGKQSPRARLASHDLAPPRHRPHASHLQVPRPLLPPDGCARRSSEADLGVNRLFFDLQTIRTRTRTAVDEPPRLTTCCC